MKIWLYRLPLTAIAFLIFFGPSSGQEPAPAQFPPSGAPVVPAPPPARGPFQSCLNKHGLGCWAHHTQMGCGSFHSEMRFMFGSCRTFFSERCIPNPPHSDRDPYWRNPCGGPGGTGNCNQ
ncbi:MAG: hypothetical protein HY040_02820 [Planctomycetes bacterium]|nr:hypothetical protein [Planctomycetota bacterium]